MAAQNFKHAMFRRVHQTERKRILASLGEHRIMLTVKSGNDELYSMVSEGLEDGKLLKTRLVHGSRSPQSDQEVIISFNLDYERYFFQGYMITTAMTSIIDVSGEFFILQRRRSARMTLPENYPCGFNIVDHSGKKCFLELSVVDFSSGGLKVYFPALEPKFSTDELIKGFLHLGIRRPFDLDGTVRHVITREEGDKKGQVFGVQFDPKNKIMEIKLLTIFMDLQRELFVKYQK